MIGYTERARRDIRALRDHYESLDRQGAIEALDAALRLAERAIEGNPGGGLEAPRSYPRLAVAGRRWIRAGRYWIAFAHKDTPVIVAVFYDSANIPGRL